MPPKKRMRQVTLGSLMGLRREGFEEPEGEKIDALTAEPLNPGKYIKIYSPDGSLVLYYNTSSLIKVAEFKGELMQPPHFMEPMSLELISEIERIEGKSFVFKNELRNLLSEDSFPVSHRRANLEEVVEDFYLLNPADVFVCPLCYAHYLWTIFVPSLENHERWNNFFNSGTPPPLDPLDVLEHMRLHPITVKERFSDPLVHIVFKVGKHWSEHMKIHHGGSEENAREYRLRDFLCTFYSSYNHENELNFKKLEVEGGNPNMKPPMTQQRYWALNAGYNKLRYNRIVDHIDAVTNIKECLQEIAFRDDALNDQFNVEVNINDDMSDFVVNDSDVNDSSASDEESYNGPRYSPSESSCSTTPSTSPERKRKKTNDENSDSCSSDSSCSDVDSEESATLSQNVDRLHVYDSVSRRWKSVSEQLTDERLSVEDHIFLQKNALKEAPSNVLYDPILHQVERSDVVPDSIDFEHLGETLQSTQTVRIKVNPNVNVESRSSGKLLLLDEDEEAQFLSPREDKYATTPEMSSGQAHCYSKLLLDNDE